MKGFKQNYVDGLIATSNNIRNILLLTTYHIKRGGFFSSKTAIKVSSKIMAGVSEPNEFHFSFKIVFVGDAGVGKSSLLQAEMHPEEGIGSMDGAPVQTAGVQFSVKLFDVSGRIYRVHYWDCPGAERYMNLTSRYCAGAAGVVFVFDVNKKSSFQSLEKWIEQVDKNNPSQRILVANKCDDASAGAREVSSQEVSADSLFMYILLYPNNAFIFFVRKMYRRKRARNGTTWSISRRAA